MVLTSEDALGGEFKSRFGESGRGQATFRKYIAETRSSKVLHGFGCGFNVTALQGQILSLLQALMGSQQ